MMMKDMATPHGHLPHVLLYGAVNSGKSTLFNLLLHEEYSIVSPIAGTTTDVVYKRMELPQVGAVVLMDTPGVCDESELGAKRMAATQVALRRADVVVVLLEEGEELEAKLINEYPQAEFIPIIRGGNKYALRDEVLSKVIKALQSKGVGVERSITGSLAGSGDLVLLVTPQDEAAPKGRLIQPQVLTIRELLDKHCIVMTTQLEELASTLNKLSEMPDLVITDSQVFGEVAMQLPIEIPLTSFSVLMSAYKGSIKELVEGARVLNTLSEDACVLIAEACSHIPTNEDIGRVKLPHLLRKRLGDNIKIEHVNGNEFPNDLSRYDLVIHCGACMFNRPYLLSRQSIAIKERVPMTNYGIAIAQLLGILDRVALPL